MYNIHTHNTHIIHAHTYFNVYLYYHNKNVVDQNTVDQNMVDHNMVLAIPMDSLVHHHGEAMVHHYGEAMVHHHMEAMIHNHEEAMVHHHMEAMIHNHEEAMVHHDGRNSLPPAPAPGSLTERYKQHNTKQIRISVIQYGMVL